MVPHTDLRISDVRKIVAPAFHMSEDNLRVRTDQLYRQPVLGKILPGRRGGGGDREGLRATSAASALVLVTAMLGKRRETIGPAVMRMWLAKYAGDGRRCAVTGATTFGQVLIALLDRPELRPRLDSVDLMIEFDIVSVHWHDAPPSRFHPHSPKEWRKVQERARARDDGAIRITQLPGPTLEKIAQLIAAGEPEGRPA